MIRSINMKVTILILLAASWTARCQEEQDLLRLSRRPSRSDGHGNYKTSVIHSDNTNNRKHSISTVTVQLRLKDNKPIPIESDDEDYVTAPGIEQELQIQPANVKRQRKHPVQDDDVDSDTGASNSHASARYMLPPEGFMNQMNQMKQNQGHYQPNNDVQVDHQLQYQQQQHYQRQQQHHQPQPDQQRHYQSPPMQESPQHPTPIDRGNNQQYDTSASHMHYVSTPAPPHFTSSASAQPQFYSSPPNYPVAAASQMQYVSASSPITQFNMNQNNQQSNMRYVSASPQSMQFVSTPSPSVVQYSSQPPQQNQHVQYFSTPAPNVQYVSTPVSHDNYVSSPVHFASTPSPIQYSTSSPNFGSRIEQVSSNAEKQLHIDHFDNAMSGMRNPKYPPSNNIFTSTPAPMLVSTTITPLNPQKQNGDQWRSNTVDNVFMSNVQLQQEPQQNSQNNQYQKMNSNNFQDQSSNLNAVESSNNYAVNVVHPYPSVRHRFQMSKVTNRDVEKDTDVATAYSNGDYGWKLAPKKTQNNEQNSISFSSSSFSTPNTQQVLDSIQSAPYEYRPYPDNPFLNHISFPSPSPPIKSGSVQSINFQPDHNEQQNVNVGYSIGFGNGINNQEVLKAEPSVYANKYPFITSVQSFTTAFPNPGQNDVVKGVQVSQINVPETQYYLKNNVNTQDYPTNTYKVKQEHPLQYGGQSYAYNMPGNTYKLPQSLKNIDSSGQNHIFPDQPKALAFQATTPNVVTTYHGTESKNQPFKWGNISPGIDYSGGSPISSVNSLIIDVPESSTPSSVVYLNNPNGNVGLNNNPYYFKTEKQSNGRIIQTFDHANAIKNTQPIDISNVVSYTPTPMPDTNSPVTISPHYISGHTLQSVPAQMNNPIPQGHYIQHYPQDQSHLSTGSMGPQSFINHNNNFIQYKPVDQSVFKDKNILYNVHSFKPKFNQFDGNSFNEYGTSYFYGKPGEQAFESSIRSQNIRPSDMQTNYAMHPSADMIGHSSNIEQRHIANMMYVPSETFRNQNSGLRDLQGEPSSAVHVSRMQPEKSLSYQQILQRVHPDDLQGEYTQIKNNYDTDTYEGRLNQNIDSHNIEPLPSNSDTNYHVMKNINQRQNGQEVVYEQSNEVDTSLTTINGIKVSNPYNVDLRLVSDMLRGKAAVDESRLEPIREQMSRLSPIKIDTARLQEAVTKNEKESSEPTKTREYVDIDSKTRVNMNKLRSLYKNKNYNVYTDQPKPFESKYEKDEQRFQHNVPNIASEQLHNSLQSVLNTHQIGAVIEQEQQSVYKSRPRNREPNEEYNQYNLFEAINSELSDGGRDQHSPSSVHHPNALATEDAQPKHPKQDANEPYPLLTPPRPPTHQRSHKRSEKRPLIGSRHNRILGHKHRRPSKMSEEPEAPEDFEPIRIPTELRPPPVNLKKKIG